MTPRACAAAFLLILASTFVARSQSGPASLRSGIDLASMDRSVRPQDDLYRFVNGGWLARTPMPADRVSYGTFVELNDQVEADLRAIIEAAAAAPKRSAAAQQIVDLYASMLDEARIEALGLEPIRPELRTIDAIRTPRDLAIEIARLASINAGGPFGGSLAEDPARPGVPVAQVSQGGTLLPDRDYYVNGAPQYAGARKQYEQYLVTIFTLVGMADARADAPAAAAAVLALETELARAQWSPVDSRDPLRTANRFALGELPSKMPGFEWLAWGLAQGFDRDQPIVLMQPSFFARFAELARSTPLDTWKAWLAARYVTAIAPYVTRAVNMARFEFFGRVITGQEAPRPRWKRGVGIVATMLGDAIGRLYVERHFPPASKARAEALVANVVAAFRDAIRESAWMTAPTKARALDKLSKLAAKVGYPDRWRDYRGLSIRPDDLLGNVQRSEKFDAAWRRSLIGQPPRSGEWLLPPHTVNAFYAPASNDIVLPAAILQPPFFDPEADDAANYGGIGAVIGHEIGHGFDERGRHVDGRGAPRDWWTPQDEAAFHAATRPLVEQFSAESPMIGMRINGELTFAENAGDVGGLAIAWRAYTAARGGRPAPVLDGFTGEQRFFISWARVWRGLVRDDYLREWLLTFPYAPPAARANMAVGHVPAFFDAFGVKPGDRLYREPGQRVKIW